MITLEKVLVLKSVGLFANTPDEILVEIALTSQERVFSTGENIIHEDEYNSDMYIIVSGSVKVHDKNKMLAKLGENDVFGELAALSPEKRIASVTALSDTLLLKISSESIYELMELNTELSKGIIQFLCNRIRTIAKDKI